MLDLSASMLSTIKSGIQALDTEEGLSSAAYEFLHNTVSTLISSFAADRLAECVEESNGGYVLGADYHLRDIYLGIMTEAVKEFVPASLVMGHAGCYAIQTSTSGD